MQESPDFIPEGDTPLTITMYVYDTLVDYVKSGDKVEVVGLYRSSPIRMNSRTRNIKSVHKTYIDIMHIRRINIFKNKNKTKSLNDALLNHQNHDSTESQLEERENEIRELAKSSNLYEKLSNSIAPSIFGL